MCFRARSKSHGSRTNPSTKGTGSDVLMQNMDYILSFPEIQRSTFEAQREASAAEVRFSPVLQENLNVGMNAISRTLPEGSRGPVRVQPSPNAWIVGVRAPSYRVSRIHSAVISKRLILLGSY
jgi:hypothetical protein